MVGTSEKRFTGLVKCGHCLNTVHMEIVAQHSEVEAHDDHDFYYEAGWVYEVTTCPACTRISFLRYLYHDALEPDDFQTEYLYPRNEKALRGLPPKIYAAYEAAQRVRNIEANAYAVLLGRVLDAVCADRQASGSTLDQKLKHLAEKGEIPDNLVKVAAGIRRLRNIGAHADLGHLTAGDLPVLDELTRAILEYVYSAPLLAKEAEQRFAELTEAENVERENGTKQ